MIAYTSLTIDLLEMEEKMITRTPQKLLKSLHLRKKIMENSIIGQGGSAMQIP